MLGGRFLLLLDDLLGDIAGESSLDLVELLEAVLGDHAFLVILIVGITAVRNLLVVGGVTSLSHLASSGPDA